MTTCKTEAGNLILYQIRNIHNYNHTSSSRQRSLTLELRNVFCVIVKSKKDIWPLIKGQLFFGGGHFFHLYFFFTFLFFILLSEFITFIVVQYHHNPILWHFHPKPQLLVYVAQLQLFVMLIHYIYLHKEPLIVQA